MLLQQCYPTYLQKQYINSFLSVPLSLHHLSPLLSLSFCKMSQPLLRIHNPSSISSTHNSNFFSNHSDIVPSSFPCSSSSLSFTSHSSSISVSFRAQRPLISFTASSYQQQQPQELSDSPLSVELIPISNDQQFDQVVAHNHDHQHPLIIAWMANWCRKCIYLKPKLEKLAAEYSPRIRFYSVDVNTVSHKLVARAGVTKMPTIQLWKDGEKQAEVIGGHKAYWVIGDVQEMIENECTM